MSISPAQMMLQVASAENPGSPWRSTNAPTPAEGMAANATGESPATAAAVSSPPQLSTDMQIDSEHQIYYKFVDDSTGDVLFEIPPEVLRAIGEGLNVPLVGDASVPNIDVKS